MALPVTTLFPIGNPAILPACASSCGPLFDANGACVPPAAPTAAASVYDACFCSFPPLIPFSSVTIGVCEPGVCSGPGELNSIATWFRSFCGGANDAQPGAPTTSSSSSSTGATGSPQSGTTGGGSGGDWLSGHWQWVVMLIVLVIVIAGCWVGACIWRRAYLRRKDRQSLVMQKHSGSTSHPSWGPAVTGDAANTQAPGYGMYGQDRSQGGVLQQQGPVSAFDTEKPRRKWNITERT